MDSAKQYQRVLNCGQKKSKKETKVKESNKGL